MIEIRLTDSVSVPWRNGGGQTRELMTWPHGEHWCARFSVAQIDQSGPFSEFVNTTRWFTLIEGETVNLSVAGQSVDLDTESPPFLFDGAQPCNARLHKGRVLAFNLMLRGGWRAQVQRRLGGQPLGFCGEGWVALFCVRSGSYSLSGQTHRKDAGSFIWCPLVDAKELVLNSGQWIASHLFS